VVLLHEPCVGAEGRLRQRCKLKGIFHGHHRHFSRLADNVVEQLSPPFRVVLVSQQPFKLLMRLRDVYSAAVSYQGVDDSSRLHVVHNTAASSANNVQYARVPSALCHAYGGPAANSVPAECGGSSVRTVLWKEWREQWGMENER
jgi:hypothetical protein